MKKKGIIIAAGLVFAIACGCGKEKETGSVAVQSKE